ncbi:RnfABCDGE type electron transport complex subunit D [Paracoccus seriniphilus]|uniref:Na+-transporting NADH:ubiquinone oxidoreductase subunit B n=1 Tax=Paracoccus seriniphilus TaxID=184748 RepID=A0A239PV57_9RHOB|nr:RnfABCDGE type electron transport complex subunit D [Paracoccus seriniphilus]WCR15349.1 RnfABCDGE type electron transport complex subunit D [Paracoccus seriniphilus]SNT73826.1 Na+-transporting NADH:ubiquinone oxidoreductase subunit B [Paracoccus seriniphilus]
MRRGLWDREMVALLLLLAIMPMVLAWLAFGGLDALWRLVFALVVSGIWHLVFMLARAQPPSFAGALSSVAIAMLAPQDLGVGQMVMGISFGTVMAELVFGGWGRNVLHPATVTLAFLGFGFPAAPWHDFAAPVSWAAIAALLMGTLFGVMSLRMILGALAVAGAGLAAGFPVTEVLPLAGIVFALLVTDPVASASTRLGGWLNGALYAALCLLFASGWQGAAPAQIAISAALLTSLSAPLLDEIAIALWLARRRRRHG